MSRKYKFRDQQKLYFVSFAVVYWLDVCSSEMSIRVSFWTACGIVRKRRGLKVYAWCVMTSHAHLVIGSPGKKMD